jgi:hypothetical protein
MTAIFRVNQLYNKGAMDTLVNDTDRADTRAWPVRPILWFATAYTINLIFHEAAHAFTAYALGVDSTLFNFWVNLDLTHADVSTRAIIGITGPLFGLAFGFVCWFMYRRFHNSAAGIPLIYLSAFGLTMFFGNLMSASFVGDFSATATLLDLPMSVRYTASLVGAVCVAAILFVTGRELRRWAPRYLGRIAAALAMVASPVLAGTAFIILANQPMPMPGSFLAARAGEASFWIFGLAGTLVGHQSSTAPSTVLRLRWMDLVAAFAVIVLARVMARGIALMP